MRMLPTTVLALCAVTLAACERSNPAQPERALTPNALHSNGNGSGKPEIDPTYANGKTVYMIGPHIIPGARESMPNAYAHAQELYLLTYPPGTNGAPITLPSGYQPQCNPCFHPGLPLPFVYHDHVITGAPGMGNNGTAGEYKGPWKIIILKYNPEYANSPTFTPITSEAAIDSAEHAGGVFLPINQGPGNPDEIDTGNLLICPTVSNHA
jgi:hypothetical protein